MTPTRTINPHDGAFRRATIGLPPFLTWYLLILLGLSILWPRYGLLGSFVSPYLLLSASAWIAVPTLLFLRPGIYRRLVARLSGKLWVVAAFAAWMGWRLLTSAVGDTPSESVAASVRDIVYFAPLLPLAVLLLDSERGYVAFLRMIVVTTLIVIAVSYWEQVSRQTIGQLLNLTVSGDPTFQAEMLRPSYRAGDLRSKSVFLHPIVLGQYLSWVAPLLLLSLGEKIGALFKTGAIVGLCLLTGAILFTGTRSGLISAAAATGLYFLLLSVQRSRLSFGAALLMIGFVGLIGYFFVSLGQDLFADLVSGRDSAEFSSTLTRLRMLEIGLASMQASPIVGFGDGRAAFYAGNFTGNSAFATIDNFYLSTMLNNGFVGLFIMAIAWGWLMLAAFKVALVRRLPYDSAVAASVASLLLSFSIVSITDAVSLMFLSLAMLGSMAARSAPADTSVLGRDPMTTEVTSAAPP